MLESLACSFPSFNTFRVLRHQLHTELEAGYGSWFKERLFRRLCCRGGPLWAPSSRPKPFTESIHGEDFDQLSYHYINMVISTLRCLKLKMFVLGADSLYCTKKNVIFHLFYIVSHQITSCMKFFFISLGFWEWSSYLEFLKEWRRSREMLWNWERETWRSSSVSSLFYKKCRVWVQLWWEGKVLSVLSCYCFF